MYRAHRAHVAGFAAHIGPRDDHHAQPLLAERHVVGHRAAGEGVVEQRRAAAANRDARGGFIGKKLWAAEALARRRRRVRLQAVECGERLRGGAERAARGRKVCKELRPCALALCLHALIQDDYVCRLTERIFCASER